MPATAKRYLPFALVVLASVWISLTNLVLGGNLPSVGPGDYPNDAGPPIAALVHWHLSAFLSSDYVMGPFSLLLRAPFAALAGADQLAGYRWGAFPCVLAAGFLGLYLSRLARRRGCTPLAGAAIVVICLFNPLTFEALQVGHPEEVLTAALAVAAVAVASEGHGTRAALLLGLAVASKQWAVIAILPVLMALPSRRLAVGVKAAAVVLILVVPGVVAQPHVFAAAQGNVAFGQRFIDSWSAWYPFAGATPGRLVSGPHGVTVTPFAGGSALIGRYAHPFIVLSAFAVPLAIALRRRRFALSGPDAMALLVLLALLRCALDPSDNAYYHAPVLLALAGWDALASRGLPLRAIAGAAIALALTRWSAQMDPQAFNALYLAIVVPTAGAIALALWRPSRRASRRPAALAGTRAPRTAATS